MKHQVMLEVKHFSRSLFEFRHIPNLENIMLKIKHFPNFQDFEVSNEYISIHITKDFISSQTR